MPDLALADALRLAINVLRDSAESRKMPSGVVLDDARRTRTGRASEGRA